MLQLALRPARSGSAIRLLPLAEGADYAISIPQRLYSFAIV
jgi:hypothetical protein